MKVWAAQAEYLDVSDQQISWWELSSTEQGAKELAEKKCKLYHGDEEALKWYWVEAVNDNGSHWAAEVDLSFNQDGSSVRYYSVFEIEVK